MHQYTAVVTTEPTCEQPGITTYTCTSCGHKYIDYVPAALGHDYVAKVVKEATCDDLGEVLYTCSRCGDSYTEQLDPLDHVFGEEVVTPPTCEKKATLPVPVLTAVTRLKIIIPMPSATNSGNGRPLQNLRKTAWV